MKKMLATLRAYSGWLMVLALGVGGYFGYQSYLAQQAAEAQTQARAALRTEAVQRGNIIAQVSATGAILPEQQVNVFFQLPGTVAAVLVESGATIKTDEVIARLDDTELRLAVQQATDALTIAQLNRDKILAGPSASDVTVAQANLRGANATAYDISRGAGEQETEIAQLQYDAQQSAYQKLADQYNSTVQFAQEHPQFAPGQDMLDALKSSMESAYYAAEIARLQVSKIKEGSVDRGALSVAYAQIAQAQAVLSQTLASTTATQIARADLAVAQAETALAVAQLRLSRAELRAPFAGIVAIVNIKVGENTGAQPALVLIDTSQFHLDVSVDEMDVAQLTVGQAVNVTVDALPEFVLSGRVDRIAPTATNLAGVINYAVRLVLDPTAAPLRTGMSATAAVTVAEARDVVLVPNWAIRRDRRTGQAYASVKVGDTLTEVAIETGLRGETYTEVTSGVNVGDVAAISTAREELDLFRGP